MSELVCCATCEYLYTSPERVPCCVCKNWKLWSKNEDAAMYGEPITSPLNMNCAAHRGEKTGGM